MKLSEVGLMQPVLCKNAEAVWSEVFEIMKLGYSENKKAVYVRMTFGAPGQSTASQHYWRDVVDLDKKWEVFDTLAANAKLSGGEAVALNAGLGLDCNGG